MQSQEGMMATTAKIGLLIPCSFAGDPPNLPTFIAFARQAEDLGFHALWVTDRIFHTIHILDPLTLLTCAAAVTSRIGLGTAVLLAVFRNPVLLAKATATLDYLSGGRLILGVSLGGRDEEFEALGVPIKRRVSVLREHLSVMRKLWTEPQVTFHGRYYHLDHVTMEPKPVQKPSIPILMGGRADAVLQRSAEEAEGWIAGGYGDAEAFREAWQKVRAYALAAGRDPDALDAGKLLHIMVGEDRHRCLEQLRAFTLAYYGRPYEVEHHSVFGPPQECAARIQGFIDAGAKTLMLWPTWPDVEQATRIAREVVPLLR
jgi:probable F420-dependent oxidoreductase